jgi:4-amino-4-deoxy-L-arabinose transferase-like glycosyltransferase
MKYFEQNPLILMALIWGTFIAVSVFALPLLPVDETRYMTVAWEINLQKSWLLPTLNFEPYSHKPPLLFWLINGVWQLTGFEIWGVRIMSGLIAFLTLPLTYILAKNLIPDNKDIAKYAPVILMASPVFFVYGTLIMFDFLLAVFTLLALICAVKAERNNVLAWWLGFGVAVGLGVLTKGPVILIHVLFPFLLAPLWGNKRDIKQWAVWYVKLVAALILAAALALSWALPAAELGGAAFKNEIFWSQSAGRMSNSFAHEKPFWFYFPILLVIFLPFVLWPQFWKAFKAYKSKFVEQSSFAFLMSWIIPVLISFSLISGKQIHYLIPLMPAFAILLSLVLSSRQAGERDIEAPFWGFMTLFMVLHFSPLFFGWAGFGDDPFYVSTIDAKSNLLSTAFVGIFLITSIILRDFFSHQTKGQLISLVFMSFLLVSLFALQMQRKGFEYYDLRPAAKVLAESKDRPIAINKNYHGEFGFLAKLDQPIEWVQDSKIDEWLSENENGVVIYRHKFKDDPPNFQSIYKMPYRSNGEIQLLEPTIKE